MERPEHPPPAAAGGIDARLTQLLNEYGRVVRAALGRLRLGELGLDAAEIEQDVRIRLWRGLADERPIRDVASYVYRVASTAAIDALRRVRARREDPLDGSEPPRGETSGDAESAAVGRLDRRELLRRVEEALSGLSADRRRAVELHLQGFGSAEVAALQGWTEPRARNLVYRGLAELRASLRDRGIDYAGE